MNNVLLLIPLAAILSLFLLYWCRHRSLIRSLAYTWLSVVAFVWAVTEVLSVFRIWNQRTVLVIWILFLAINIVFMRKKKAVSVLKKEALDSKLYTVVCGQNKVWMIIFGGYFVLILIVAALSSQNNVDAMKYHLPRIMHWIQNESTWYYATGIDFQVRYPSLAEYLVAQIFLFTDFDRLVNLVQTVAFMTSAVMVYGIAQRMGASKVFSFFSAFIYSLMPMAVAQTFNAQTDIIAGMFLLVYIYILLDFIQAEKLVMDKHGFISAVYLAASVMFGYLCKPTICFDMVVFFVWMVIARLYKRDKFSELIRFVVVGVLTAAIICTPLLAKNYYTYFRDNTTYAAKVVNGDQNAVMANISPVYLSSVGYDKKMTEKAVNAIAPDNLSVVNGIKDPKLFAITCLKNMARNSASACFPKWNSFVEKSVYKAADILDVDAGTFYLQSSSEHFNRDRASNPAVMLLGALSCIAIVFAISHVNRSQRNYAICAIVGFIVQCGLMGYTEFRTRYLVGAMAVLCPMFGIVLSNLRWKLEYSKMIMISLATFASFGAINTLSYEVGYVIESFGKDNVEEHFYKNNLQDAYRMVVEHISNNEFTTVGIEGVVQMEYVLWAGIENLERIDYVNVNDPGLSQYEDLNYIPKCIYKESNTETQIGEIREVHGQKYVCDWMYETRGVYYTIYVCSD